MLSILAWRGLAAFVHTGTWRDIATAFLVLALLGALRLWFHAD